MSAIYDEEALYQSLKNLSITVYNVMTTIVIVKWNFVHVTLTNEYMQSLHTDKVIFTHGGM